MDHIGYSLVDGAGNEASFWGDTIGQIAGLPDVIALPNGDTVHGATLGEQLGAWRLVERYGQYGAAASTVYDGTRVVVTWAVTPEMVQRERARRLAAGFDYTFADARGTHRIGTTAADLVGWDEVTTISNALIATGMGSQIIHVQTDTGPLDLTAIEWQSVLLASAQFRQPIWLASFAILAKAPIPADYASNIHW